MKKGVILLIVIVQAFYMNGQVCSPETLEQRGIKANTTNNQINWELQNHQVFVNTECTPNEKLIIHLVGSFDNPANTTYFPSMAANNGFKVINLKYPNSTAAISSCVDSSDPSCFEDYRQEIIFGSDKSSAVDVDENNCIVNRVEKLLLYLHDKYPSENWDSYLINSTEINWSKVILSGHSQGGGHAAFLAKQFAVDRVLMFASPTDNSEFFSAPAEWLSGSSETPDSNYFAFGNLYDDVIDFAKLLENWQALGLQSRSDSTNVAHSDCNFGNANMLYTTYDESSVFSASHNNTIIDAFTPLTEGEPMFMPVWKYMLGLCENATSSVETIDQDRHVNIYPNPASSSLYIESEPLIEQVELFSSSGILLQKLKPFAKDLTLDVKSYTGILILKMALKDSVIEVRRVMIF